MKHLKKHKIFAFGKKWMRKRKPYQLGVLIFIAVFGTVFLIFLQTNFNFHPPSLKVKFHPREVKAQNFNPPYPRIAQFTWGGARPEWYAKADLLDIGHGNAELLAEKIKAINPNIIIHTTSDWNAGAPLSSVPREWCLKKPDGTPVRYWGSHCLTNLTDLAPVINGKKPNEAIPERVAENFKRFNREHSNILDGVGSDGLWDGVVTRTNQPIDLNGDGVDDSRKDPDWVDSEWKKGVRKILTRLRELIGPDKIIIINGGAPFLESLDQINGNLWERSWGFMYDWNYGLNLYFRTMEKARSPHAIIIDGASSFTNKYNKGKNSFMTMRFLLTTTLLGDGYFDFHDYPNAGEHEFLRYYDEYDLDLGYPTSPPYQLPNGVYVRFFDKGVSMVNPTGRAQTVTDEDLKRFSEYNGPYYRFKGGQDPVHNNGQLFREIELFGDTDPSVSANNRIGDGIILLREPTVVVSDIIIDNVDPGTSPGSEQADLQGSWHPGCDGNGKDPNLLRDPDSWTVGPYWCSSVYRPEKVHYHYANPEEGISIAIFRPTINVPGYYEVFEWHPERPGVGPKASNVPYEIKYAQGTKKGEINQRINSSQWNSLGVYYFNQGTQGYVKISTENADGIVIADAFKFVYKGQGGSFCTCSRWEDDKCGGGNCPSNQMHQKGTDCIPPGCTLERCVENPSCQTSASVRGDLNGDSRVDIIDLGILFSNWGSFQKENNDLNQDGVIDSADFAILISNWSK